MALLSLAPVNPLVESMKAAESMYMHRSNYLLLRFVYLILILCYSRRPTAHKCNDLSPVFVHVDKCKMSAVRHAVILKSIIIYY